MFKRIVSDVIINNYKVLLICIIIFVILSLILLLVMSIKGEKNEED